MTARGTSSNLQFGPGKLYAAPLGSTEPTDLTTALDAAWILLGYTEDGSSFSAQVQTAEVKVAEEVETIKFVTTSRSSSVSFSMSEILAKNLAIAYNGGTIGSGTGIVTFDPPGLGNEVRRMLLWESETADERWIFRQCLSSGNVQIDRKPAENNAAIPVTMSLEKPDTLQPWRAILDDARA